MNGGALETVSSKKPNLNKVVGVFLQKPPVTKGKVATPVPLRGRLPVACTPTSQQRSQGAAGRSTLCGKGSTKRPVLSAAKMNVR